MILLLSGPPMNKKKCHVFPQRGQGWPTGK